MLWKGKEKSKTGGAGGPKKKGLLLNLASLSRQRNPIATGFAPALCQDRVFCVAIGFLGYTHDTTWAGVHARRDACATVAQRAQ